MKSKWNKNFQCYFIIITRETYVERETLVWIENKQYITLTE